MTAPCRFGRLETDLRPSASDDLRIAVDENVFRLHHGKFEAFEFVYQVRAGEIHKTMDEVRRFWHYLWDTNANRKTTVAAEGGGVTTDLIGFAAAT
ncbi:MAG: hypothetical protein RMM53_10940, partial [Bacteroidia bacterium]|nr:hypothetical protein [Bacteroidia bacterium]